MKKRRKVLLLGAVGKVGSGFIEEYQKHYKNNYDLILGFHNKKPSIKGFKFVKADIGNPISLKKAMKGIDVVINLAANPNPEAKFSELIEPNLIGAYNVFEAAHQSKCKRVIFASSVHTIKGYPLNYKVSHDEVSKPVNFYGVSKVFGESLGYTFSYKYKLSCLAIRIGAYVSNDKRKVVCYTRHDYNYVISQRDMGQLIHRCIIAPKKVVYAILSGISDNQHKSMELKFTKKLVGYKPKDDAFKLCKTIKKSGLKK